MDLSVIIINYNTRDILKECLENLVQVRKSAEFLMEVVVVDNASSDGSADLVLESFPEVKLVANSENVGLAVGGNLGMNKSSGKYLLYLGTDAFPSVLTLSGMIEYFDKNPSVGIATCKLVLRDNSLDMDAHRGFPTPWAAITHLTKLNRLLPKSRFFNQYYLGYEDFEKPHEIDLCISHFMMIRRNVLEEVNGWDEEFFVYGEDVDLCYRVKQSGYKIMYLTQWQTLHYKGVSVGRKESKDIKTAASQDPKNIKRMKAETTRAMKLFYQKHYADKYPKVVTSSVLFAISILEKFRLR